MAANCIRSLLLHPSPSPADHSIARYLFPRLISFVTNTEPEDPEGARALVARTLAQYVAASRARLPAGMAVMVPALLSRAAGEGGEEAYPDTKATLLELAAADQTCFKAVVGGLSEGQKSLLESVIRGGHKAGGGGADRADRDQGQPTIALKMDFGA